MTLKQVLDDLTLRRVLDVATPWLDGSELVRLYSQFSRSNSLDKPLHEIYRNQEEGISSCARRSLFDISTAEPSYASLWLRLYQLLKSFGGMVEQTGSPAKKIIFSVLLVKQFENLLAFLSNPLESGQWSNQQYERTILLHYSSIVQWILRKLDGRNNLSEEEIAAWEQGNQLIQEAFKLEVSPVDNDQWKEAVLEALESLETVEPAVTPVLTSNSPVARVIYRGFAMDHQQHHDDLYLDLTPVFEKWRVGTFLIVDGVSKAHGRIATEITCKTMRHLTPQFTDVYDRNDISLFEKFQFYAGKMVCNVQEALILYKKIINHFNNRKNPGKLYNAFFNLIGVKGKVADERLQRAARTEDTEEYLREILSWVIDDPVEVVRRVVTLSEAERDFQLATTVILVQTDGKQACYITVGDGYVGTFKYTEIAESRFVNVIFQGNDTPLHFTLRSDDGDIDISSMVFKPSCPVILLFGSDGLSLQSGQVRELFDQCLNNHFNVLYERANDDWKGDLVTQEDMEVLAEGFIEILKSKKLLRDDATVGITFIDPTGILINGETGVDRGKRDTKEELHKKIVSPLLREQEGEENTVERSGMIANETVEKGRKTENRVVMATVFANMTAAAKS
ncbi:MAG: hypothetical protein ACFFD4_05190 [Candidatus Odinarchaeota archaeon]